MKPIAVTCPQCEAPPGELCVVGRFGIAPRLRTDARGRVWGRFRTRPHDRRYRLAARQRGPLN